MYRILTIAILAGLILLGGCSTQSGDILLNVDFPENQTLRYKFLTNREVDLSLNGSGGGKEQTTTEGLEMVVAYTPIETDIYGNTTVEAVCESIKINRQTLTSRPSTGDDPVASVKGKSWQFTVNSFGEIQDYSGMQAVVKSLGEKAITESGKRRIKDPDLIWDFVATQWFMWDALSSNKKLYSGVSAGDSWNSALLLPFGVRIPAERSVEYTVDENYVEGSDIVSINSLYDFRGYENVDGKLTFRSILENMPQPYEGSFQTRGMFGFLRDYKAERLEGEGKASYDINRGILLSDSQRYEVDMTAAFMFPLGDTSPVLNVVQTIDIELIDGK